MSAFYAFSLVDVSSLSANNVVILIVLEIKVFYEKKIFKKMTRWGILTTLAEIHKCISLLKMRQRCWGLRYRSVEVDNINQNCIF